MQENHLLRDIAYQLSIGAIVLYGSFLIFLFIYSIVQLKLAIGYSRNREIKRKKPPLPGGEWPHVTVQLPVYNELYVIERLIDAICDFDYPKDKLEIQVLDDSTDESFEVAAKKIAEKRAQGIQIHHIRRPERKGFKAGALSYGLDICSGEFVAIFDADFIPRKDFLQKTIPYFYTNGKIGVVQTRWEHLNEEYSLLTKLQAFGLDAHFTVEQVGRNSTHNFINFNGTAGIWRKTAIYDAGGWHSDTITEDLDLSYRAQLRGWEFIYLKEIGSPSELPAEMNALKAQQFRWTKGAAECTRKNLPKVLKARHLSTGQKIHGAFHLMNSVVFLCIFGTSLLSVPMLIIKNNFGNLEIVFNIATIFMSSFFFLGFFYWISRPEENFLKKFFRFLWEYPAFLSVSMGLSLHNAIAVLEGFTGKKSAFVRTPKFAISSNSTGTWKDKKYRAIKVSPLTVLEFLMFLYFCSGIFYAFQFTGRDEKPLTHLQPKTTEMKGTDFWFTYFSGDDRPGKEEHRLVLKSDSAGNGTLESKLTGWKQEIHWKAGEELAVPLKLESVAQLNNGFYFVGGIHFRSNTPVECALAATDDESIPFMQLSPSEAYESTYDIPVASNTKNVTGEASLMAMHDSTFVEIIPSTELFNDAAQGAAFTVMLNKGDIYNILGKEDRPIDGTKIRSLDPEKTFACYTGSAPRARDFGLLPFHIMLALGYAFVTFYSLKHARG
jgi:cellulose synthase/poly-beta-1,6-N-acetylglucosamine synthase-like glycosyltransferase